MRRNPRRFPGLVRQGARALLGRHGLAVHGIAPTQPSAPGPATGTDALVAIAGRLDGEMALLADLVESVWDVSRADAGQDAPSGSVYEEARLDEQLTWWIRAEVARQRRSFL